MIRKLIFTLVASIAVTSAFAVGPKVGIDWGIIGGVNIVDFSTSDSHSSIKNKLGWQLGVTTSVNLLFFAIQPEIFYVRQGLVLKDANGNNHNIRSNSVEVPVLFSLRLLSPLRLNIGPVFNVMNDNKIKSGGDLLAVGRLKPSVSYVVGVGLGLGNLLIDVRYNGQFKSKSNFSIGDVNYDMGSYNVAINLGYLF